MTKDAILDCITCIEEAVGISPAKSLFPRVFILGEPARNRFVDGYLRDGEIERRLSCSKCSRYRMAASDASYTDPWREARTMLNLIVQLISGAVGGNIAGSFMKNLSLGTVGNSLAGILGDGIGGQLLGLLGLA